MKPEPRSILLLVLWSISILVPVGEISATPTTSAPAKQSTAELKFHQGRAALLDGDLKAAEHAFKGSLALDPKRVDALLGLADIARRTNRPEEAGHYLEQARRLAPDNAAVEHAWGRYLQLRKEFVRAEQAFRRAIELNPRALQPRLDLGNLCLNNLQKAKEATDAYRDAVALSPTDAGARFGLGLALLAAGQPDQAKKELEEATRLGPKNAMPWVALSKLHFARKEYELAISAGAKAVDIQPTLSAAHLALGDALLAKGDSEKALAAYQEADKVAPKSAPVYVKIGIAYETQQRWTEAEQAFLTAVKLDPKQAVAYNNLAWRAAERRTNLDKALVWAQQAVALQPNLPDFQDTLGWVHRARGEHKRAISVLEKASSGKTGTSVILYHLGVVYAEDGHKAKAASALERALALTTDFPGADDARRRLAPLRSSADR